MLLRRVVHNWFGRYDSLNEPRVTLRSEDHRMDVVVGPLDSLTLADEPISRDVATEALVSVSTARYFSVSELVPAELLEQILLEAWLEIPLQSPVDRWAFFANLSLVNRRFRNLVLWIATRHVRVICHSSMDIYAYRSIGLQHLSLNGDVSADPDASLAALFQRSKVYMDITYAKRWMYQNRDRWLLDDVSPGRPDDALPPVVDGLNLLHDHVEQEEPFPERRETEYLEWLRRRRRDRLSGWFADLLEAVPDCTAVEISAADDDAIETLSVKTYGILLESLWWWPSLSALHLSAVPGQASFPAEMSGYTLGPRPVLPSLPSVKTVRLSRYPDYTAPDNSDGLVFHPDSRLQVLYGPPTRPAQEDHSLAYQERISPEDIESYINGGGGQTISPPPVPGLKLTRFDSLWEIIRLDDRQQQPRSLSFGGYPAPGEGVAFLFDA
ncbi:hypothetical protein ONZ51_g8307 [Trametes cubensis]|uniref:Uncharacterized protein n=1 Tax=Trametes cubensis TaxID=1111947 RepID=A0AAD7TNI3_9APHY|nr:hypothetical protein ONZ51_g8307 [Trametes cubensis]